VLLPSEEFPPSVAARKAAEKISPPSVAQAPCPLFHRHALLDFAAGPEEFITLEEKRRGEFIHKVLSLIEYAGDGFEAGLPEIIRRVGDETGSAYSAEEMKPLVMSLTGNHELAGYFRETPNREVRNEQEYVDGSGRLFRMDRVIIDPDSVTVIDYKTGKDGEAREKHRAQLRNYMRILAEVYPGKSVGGIIAFVDLGEVERLG
jgi:hypothetical protein